MSGTLYTTLYIYTPKAPRSYSTIWTRTICNTLQVVFWGVQLLITIYMVHFSLSDQLIHMYYFEVYSHVKCLAHYQLLINYRTVPSKPKFTKNCASMDRKPSQLQFYIQCMFNTMRLQWSFSIYSAKLAH